MRRFAIAFVLCMVPAWTVHAGTQVTVKRVIDGNTLQVVLESGKEEKVRLLYVKTQRSVQADKERGTGFGEEAFRFAKTVVSFGTKAILEFEEGREQDFQGNLTAYVYVVPFPEKKSDASSRFQTVKRDGVITIPLNDLLIRHGHSPYYTYSGKSKKYDESFTEHEKHARENKLGIWSTEESAQKYLRRKSMWDDRAVLLERMKKNEPMHMPDRPGLEAVGGQPRPTIAAGRLLCMRGSGPVRIVPPRQAYVASRKSDKFHRLDCVHAKKIKPEDLVRYRTREEAINDGNVPCETCKP